MTELPKTYDPNSVEPKWYQHWLERGYFKADAHSPKPAFSIVIPPPNITGMLTMGHVLNNTIQDILARRARMLGHETLWLPGTDHAGVATQTAVEKHVWKTEKKTKHDLGREVAGPEDGGLGDRLAHWCTTESVTDRESVDAAGHQ